MKFVKLETRCGAPLFVLEMPYTESVDIGISVRVGTRDEIYPKEAGLAHALEHMVFRGNEKFPTGKEVSNYIEEVGGEMNAWTCKEIEGFYARLPKNQWRRGITAFYHLLETPLFREKDIESEMNTVVQEIKMNADDPTDFAEELLDSLAYANHPLGKAVLGRIETVKSFRTEDFRRFHNAFFHPTNYVFIAVGNVKAKEILREIDGLFREEDKKSPNRRIPVLCREKDLPRTTIVRREIKQVHLYVGSAIGSVEDRSTTVLGFFTTLIGSGLSSPLFQELRDKRGLCYEINSFIAPWSDRGLFYVYAGTEPEKCSETLEVISEIIWKNRKNRKLFEEGKRKVAGAIALNYDDPASIFAEASTEAVLRNKPQTPQEMIEKIRSIEFDEMVSAVETYLKPENFYRAIVAPKKFKIKIK